MFAALSTPRGPTTFRIIEWFGLEGTLKGRPVQPYCTEQVHLQLDQVAQSPVQPDLARFQGWLASVSACCSPHVQQGNSRGTLH